MLVLLAFISLHMTFLGEEYRYTKSTDTGSFSSVDPAVVRFEARLFKRGDLAVYAGDGQRTMAIGDYVYFTVERDGEIITYHDLTYEVVNGRDCGRVYYSGGLRGLGEGIVVIKAFLDVDPSVYGYGTVRILPAREESAYTEQSAAIANAPEGDTEFESSISGFPESYRPYLRELHAKYPSWMFEPFYTGLDFSNAVYDQGTGDKNVTLDAVFGDLIKRKGASDYDRETGKYVMKDTGWVSVNNIAVSYFMDPRNFLGEKDIFQFEVLSYDESFHSVDGVEGILKGSFMHHADTGYLDTDGNQIASQKTYAEVIFEAGKQAGISPYFIASKIKQEIGSTPSMAATGTCPGYEGLYNFYNIGATDGEGNIERGLAWAGSGESFGRPWTSPEKSIIGGAEVIAQDYVNVGQFTGYLQKFNVNPDAQYGLHSHQYMTNVSGSASQGSSVYAGYEEVGLLNSPFVFSIPVFDNMPGATKGRADAISIAGETPGVVTHGAVLRSGPAAYYGAVADITLMPYESVTVKRAVSTDAAYYTNRLYFPAWYEVSVLRGGVEYTGYVCEEYVSRAAMSVMEIGGTQKLGDTVTPSDSDEIIYYISENPDIASVSSDGMVTATGSGYVKIIGYTSSGAIDCAAILVM